MASFLVCTFSIWSFSAGAPLTLKPSSPLTRREEPLRSGDYSVLDKVFIPGQNVAAEISGAGSLIEVKDESQPVSLGEKRAARIASGLLPASLPLNGNFEQGTDGAIPTYWGQTQSIPGLISTVEAHNGTKSLKLEKDHELVSGWAADSCFEIESGVTYVMSFWAKTSTAGAEMLTMFPVYSNFAQTAFRRALVTTDNSFQMFHTIPVSTEWNQYSHQFTAGEATQKVRLLIGCLGGTIYLDDLSFSEECSEAINVYGAENVQAASMGVFTRQAKDKSGLPVYKNEHHQYLYFWGDFDSWLIGPDYHSEAAANLQSPNSVSQGCPTTVTGQEWSVKQDATGFVHGNGTFKWVSMSLSLDRVPLMS